ncbi:MAG: hypothetical protein Q7S34_00520, partial [bacterium]|nr:hypothetical protein [bacterium]
MWVFYLFFLSLFGIVILLSLKVWELHRGAKPFSVLRYRLDLFFRRKMEELRGYQKYLNTKTIRLVLVYLVAMASRYIGLLIGKIKESRLFQTIKGKVVPGNGNGPVSAFLRDVAEFKKGVAGENKKTEEGKEET